MAMGVAFGLGMSLLLKHSSLHVYPGIESCLVALSAYTCYFFSTGIGMSGIVSLLFCGITLKHYAYHTMSRRTQHTTKYIFQILAKLSENFIFIYLGMSLFTGAPTAKVTSYFKPIFIVIATMAVIFTRYAAVFPLSELINLFHRHVRGQRTEELPHSYQMMLFWAGLRGAVGVALAAGFKGDNAETLRTTVLVVVVLTVVLFGGTTARMLEVLGIRTGVEDEAASSDDEDENPIGRELWGGGRRRGRWSSFAEEEPSYVNNHNNNRGGFARGAAAIGSHYATRPHYNHHGHISPAAILSASSSDSDSDGEVLPLAPTHTEPTPGAVEAQPDAEGAVERDGKWFQALDERYLLPLFSNATASRTFHARRARRSTLAAGGAGASALGTPVDSDDDDEVDLGAGDEATRHGAESTGRTERRAPILRTGSVDRIPRANT